MIYDHVSIGGGVIGLNTTINLLKKFLNCKFKKKINLCIIDKDLSNIPGGVAYGKKTSRHGYFNNPLRLSHKELQKYYLNYKNFNKLEDFIKLNGSQYDHRKFKIDLKILKSKNIKKKMEVYLPRVAFSFFQESIFCDLINKIQKSKKFVNLDFYQGDVHTFTNYKKKYLKITSNKSFEIFQLNSQLLNNKRISFLRKFFFDKSIIAKNITLGLGVTPPDKLIEKKNINNNYIWDFYSEGGTSYLVNKIENMVKAKKNLSLCFIGSKAGFLESLQEIYKAKIKYKSIKIYCFSKKFESLQPAKISFKKKITLKFLKKSRKDINTASKLYSAIFNELTVSKKKNRL